LGLRRRPVEIETALCGSKQARTGGAPREAERKQVRLQLRFWRTVCLTLLAAMALSSLASAQQAAKKSTGQPPLLDRELFFGDPEISGARISPDGKFIAFLKPYKDARNIWVKRTEEPFNAARPITNDTKRPIPDYFWSWDGKYILFVQDKGGDENFNIYAV